jgi:hypothetical protein
VRTPALGWSGLEILFRRKFVTLGVLPPLCRCLIDGAASRRLVNACNTVWRSSSILPIAILQELLHKLFRGEEVCEGELGGSQLA